jgi:hypothetical protein
MSPRQNRKIRKENQLFFLFVKSKKTFFSGCVVKTAAVLKPRPGRSMVGGRRKRDGSGCETSKAARLVLCEEDPAMGVVDASCSIPVKTAEEQMGLCDARAGALAELAELAE